MCDRFNRVVAPFNFWPLYTNVELVSQPCVGQAHVLAPPLMSSYVVVTCCVYCSCVLNVCLFNPSLGLAPGAAGLARAVAAAIAAAVAAPAPGES